MPVPSFSDIIHPERSRLDDWFAFKINKRHDRVNLIRDDQVFSSSGGTDMKDYCEVVGFHDIYPDQIQIRIYFNFREPLETGATPLGREILNLSDDSVDGWFENAIEWTRHQIVRTGDNEKTICMLGSSEYNNFDGVFQRTIRTKFFIHMQDDRELRVVVSRTHPTQTKDGFRSVTISGSWRERDPERRLHVMDGIAKTFLTSDFLKTFLETCKSDNKYSDIEGLVASQAFRTVKWTPMGWEKMQEKFLAFSMGQHSRLGQNSGVKDLNKDNVMTITSGNHNLLDCQYVFDFLEEWKVKGRDALMKYPLVSAYPGVGMTTGMVCKTCGGLINFRRQIPKE